MGFLAQRPPQDPQQTFLQPDAMTGYAGDITTPQNQPVGPGFPNFMANVGSILNESLTIPPSSFGLDFGTPSTYWDPKVMGLMAAIAAVLEPGPVGEAKVAKGGGSAARRLLPEATGALDSFKGKGTKIRLDDLKALGYDTEKVWYHGTPGSYAGVPDPYFGKYGKYGGGAYFTESPEIASGYARGNTPTIPGIGRIRPGQQLNTPNIKPVFLGLKKPIDMDTSADVGAWVRSVNKNLGEGFGEDLASGLQNDVLNGDVFKSLEFIVQTDVGLPPTEAVEVMQNIIQDMGFDGITHFGGANKTHKVMIAFHPEQITSAFASTEDAIKNIEHIFQPPRGFNIPEGIRY